MKEALHILFILLTFISVKSQSGYLGYNTSAVYSLIIFSGESNAGGYGDNANLTTLEADPRSAVKILNNTNLLFQNLDIGTNNLIGHSGLTANASHGWENGLANSADSGTLGKLPIYLVKSGFGGGKIHHYNDSTDITYNSLNPWQILKPRVDSAIHSLSIINNTVRPNLFLVWSLGINDDNSGMNASNWKDSVKLFFAKFRLRYGHVPIFITYLPVSRVTYNAKITEIASEVTECYAIQTSDAALRDGDHWNYAGMKLIATRIIYTLKSHYTY